MSMPVDDGVGSRHEVLWERKSLWCVMNRPMKVAYGFNNTSESLDIARQHFERVKELTIKLSMVENSAYRLANSIKKTQKRANALKTSQFPIMKRFPEPFPMPLRRRKERNLQDLK